MTTTTNETASQAHNSTKLRTSSRADVVQRATQAIADYGITMGGAYDDALSLLNRALAATYAAAIDLQKDPDRLAEFLADPRPGPPSANPLHPIVRKLWKGIPTRDTLLRYASCIALAQAKLVKPADFANWLSSFPGGIKKAAAEWSKMQRLPDARVKLAREKHACAAQLLAKFKPIELPKEIGARQPGLYIAAIRVSQEGQAELVTVFDGLLPAQVNSLIARTLR